MKRQTAKRRNGHAVLRDRISAEKATLDHVPVAFLARAREPRLEPRSSEAMIERINYSATRTVSRRILAGN